jgi:hypothetical protein
MIRYEIVTKKSGVVFEASLVKKMVSTKSLSKPTVIVYVDGADSKAFEKYIEGEKDVTAYSADPRCPGKPIRDWRNK